MNALFQILKLLLHVLIELERLRGRGCHGALTPSVDLNRLDMLDEGVGVLSGECGSGVASLGQR